MSVHYKFKSTLDFDTVSFDGLHISVADLKKAIFHQKRIGKNTDFDLQITNAQTKEDYTDDSALIAKNTSLIVARIPLTVQQKRTWDRTETQAYNNFKDESNLGRSVDLTRLDGSEEDKIRAMITQSTQDYDPSNYMKVRGSNQTGEVPANYRCYKCHQPGHWIKNCPLGINQEPIEIKKSTGIPRSFMVPVEGPSVPGAMMTPGGTYAVPAIDHQAYKEGKKEKPPFAQDPEPAVEKPEIPEDLVCNICKDLLTDAVMIPCCGNSFCDECIRTYLLESEEHECPDCNEKDVSPESLIPNRYLRNAVLNFKSETGYAKQPTCKLLQSTPTLSQKIAQNNSGQDSPILEKLTISTALSAIAPTQDVETVNAVIALGVASTETEVKEVDDPTIKTSITPYVQTTVKSTTLIESSLQPDINSDLVTKLVGDDEAEVPPPPGTEPPLLLKRSSDHTRHENNLNSEIKENEYPRDREKYSRERRRSFSKDNHRDRHASYHSRMENMRPHNRRKSLSPRNCHLSEYSMHQISVHGKNYQGHLSNDSRYHPSPMHYDLNLRRSTEDRAGTPTVDEPHLHTPNLSQTALLPYPPGEERVLTTTYSSGPVPPPPSSAHNPPLLPDPYMAPPRMSIYTSHQQLSSTHGYGPPPPAPPQRFDNRPHYQTQTGYRPSQPSRSYSGIPSRPVRSMHNVGYRGMQPPPPGMGRGIHNGTGVIDDPLEAFQRMLREKDERDRRMGKHRSRRTRSRSRSRSYSRSRSRSFGRRGSPSHPSRSRSPPTKRRSSRSPQLSHRARSRTPKKRRSRSGSFSISRSRSFSRSQSPRGSAPRERDRDRKVKRSRDPLAPYRSPTRSPMRYHKERDREKEQPRSRESYGSYYSDTAAPSPVVSREYQSTTIYRELRPERLSRYASRAPSLPVTQQTSGSTSCNTILPPPPGLVVDPAAIGPSGHQVPTASQQQQLPSTTTVSIAQIPPVPGHHLTSLDRKDYYDSYNRYPEVSPQPTSRFNKRFDDVAPPGTEGYYDLLPPGIDHVERSDLHKDCANSKDNGPERYKKERHKNNEKIRNRDDRERREYDCDYEKNSHRHGRYDRQTIDRKHSKISSSPYSFKYRIDTKDSSPERLRKREKDYDEKSEDRKKEKKIKEKKKKKDSEEKEKKKKKKKEKKALIQKEAAAAVAAVAVSAAVVNSHTLPIIKVKEEPQSADEGSLTETCNEAATPIMRSVDIVVKTEPHDDHNLGKLVEEKTIAKEFSMNPEPPELMSPIKLPEISNKETESHTSVELKVETYKNSKKLHTDIIDNQERNITSVARKLETEVPETGTIIVPAKSTSPKKEEFLAPIPELSKWERDENTEKLDDSIQIAEKELPEIEDMKHSKIVTTEVLKRAENAIFQKAINAIRPIEIKKISESRKILYQNPEPKVCEPEIDKDSRKSVNVTINVGKNERNVEISSEPLKKHKMERPKLKGVLSPTRLSAKERLGDKIEDETKLANIKCIVDQRRDSNKSVTAGEITPRSRSPRVGIRERRVSLSLETRIDTVPIISNAERKVFVDDRKRERIERPRIDVRQIEESVRIHERTDLRKTERLARTPPPIIAYKLRKDEENINDDRKKDSGNRRLRDEKKRKKEHHSRSKSRDRKKRKDKKHKKDRDRSTVGNITERCQKYNKDREALSSKDKLMDESKGSTDSISVEKWKKQRRNPRLTSDRKRNILDEVNFEPDYSASDTESEDDDRSTLLATKRAKVDNSSLNVELEVKSFNKRNKQASSSEDEDSSSTESSSTESDSSVESHRKKKKKHKKRKKRKTRHDSSSDTDAYTESSDSSSEEEKHRKKKKSKGKSKQSKKKKKSKHK